MGESGVPPLPNGFTRRQIASAISPRVMELILLPTERCNFRCTYCYEDFAIGRMSDDTQRAIERLLDRRVPTLKQLRFMWFGGEPLLAKDIVLRLSEYAHDLCQRSGVQFLGSITTNGFVLDLQLAKRLIACKQDFYQITLDGWEEMHDVVRRRANGRGSFKEIWANLCALRSLSDSFEVCIRVHVRPANLDNLRVLVHNIGLAFGADSRYRVDFQILRDLGGPGGKTLTEIIDSQRMRKVEAELRAVLRTTRLTAQGREAESVPEDRESVAAPMTLGESAGSRRASEIVAGSPYVCYAAQPNSLLIRANGRIGKCTVALSDERNDLGYIKADGTVVIDRAKLQPWIEGLSTLNVAAVNCPLSVMPFLKELSGSDAEGAGLSTEQQVTSKQEMPLQV